MQDKNVSCKKLWLCSLGRASLRRFSHFVIQPSHMHDTSISIGIWRFSEFMCYLWFKSNPREPFCHKSLIQRLDTLRRSSNIAAACSWAAGGNFEFSFHFGLLSCFQRIEYLLVVLWFHIPPLVKIWSQNLVANQKNEVNLGPVLHFDFSGLFS